VKAKAEHGAYRSGGEVDINQIIAEITIQVHP
jgi:hypothetical protein